MECNSCGAKNPTNICEYCGTGNKEKITVVENNIIDYDLVGFYIFATIVAVSILFGTWVI